MYRVLLVDDEPQILEGLQLLIDWAETPFYPVDCAHNGVDALRMLKSGAYHLLIADIRMPEVSGLEVIEQARQIAPDAVSVILSGYGEFGFAQKALRLGAMDYLLKPVGADELLAVLHQAAERLRTRVDDLSVNRRLLTALFQNEPVDIERLHARLRLDRPFRLALIAFDEISGDAIKDALNHSGGAISFPLERNLMGVLCPAFDGNCAEFSEKLLKNIPVLKTAISSRLRDLYQVQGVLGAMRCALYAPAGQWHFPEEGDILDHTPASIRPVIAYINEHYMRNITLKELSRKFFINVSYLGQALKKSLGYKYNQYIMLLRIGAACRYLADGTVGIHDVALRLGYTDVNYFYRQFKSVMNITVGEYRQISP